jgi:peroxiredoxin
MKKLAFILVILIFGSGISTVFAQSQGLEPGDKAPEIKLPAPNGDIIALSSSKGKLVLIDFWGSWCAPCVKEQPELAKLYRKYKQSNFTNGKGFEIYGVSLDAKKEMWENIINKMNINWIQVSDLKFWRSPVTKTYNIQALPFNVLIDGNGIILAKNLHGNELEKVIAKFLVK